MLRRKCKMCGQFFERGVRRLHTGGVSPSMDYCPPCLLIWQRTPKKTQAEWKALKKAKK